MYHPMKMQQLNGNRKRAINSLQVECNKELIRCIAEIFNVLPVILFQYVNINNKHDLSAEKKQYKTTLHKVV
jgi:hypothetical protein